MLGRDKARGTDRAAVDNAFMKKHDNFRFGDAGPAGLIGQRNAGPVGRNGGIG